MAGNIKGFLDRYANPTTIIPEADKRNLDYKMCTAYTDGTKLNIEMALLANALDLKTIVPGMHGPKAITYTKLCVFLILMPGGKIESLLSTIFLVLNLEVEFLLSDIATTPIKGNAFVL